LKPSKVDGNLKEFGQNNTRYHIKCCAATAFCFFLCCVVAMLIFGWMTVFAGQLNIFANICLSLQIIIFHRLFNEVARRLTEWENHQFQTVFYESYLRKLVGLQFVNNYTAFFYLAVRQRYSSTGCPEIGCLEALRKQLAVSLLILSAARIVQVLFACGKVRYDLWRETSDLRKELQALDPKAEPPMRSFAEEQAKYAQFRTQEQIEAFTTLMVSIGFVLLFGAVCPIIIPFCFAVFVVQLRASAFSLTTSTKRTVPRIMFGIGAWKQVVSLLMYSGVLFAAFLTVEYTSYFDGAQLITKLTGFMIFSVSMFLIWGAVDLCFINASEETAVLCARRRHVEQRLQKAAVDDIPCKERSPEDSRQSLVRQTSTFDEIVKEMTPHDAIATAVQHRDWEMIPSLGELLSGENLDMLQEKAKRNYSAIV